MQLESSSTDGSQSFCLRSDSGVAYGYQPSSFQHQNDDFKALTSFFDERQQYRPGYLQNL